MVFLMLLFREMMVGILVTLGSYWKELIKHLLLKSTQAKLDKLNLGNPVIDISSSAESSVSTPVAERYYNGKITTETIEKNFDIWLKRWKKIMK